MSGDPEQEYFSDGLSEDLITLLSALRSSQVITRNSSFAFKKQSRDIRMIGRELSARYIIEGSVRKISNRVRVTAQLIDANLGIICGPGNSTVTSMTSLRCKTKSRDGL